MNAITHTVSASFIRLAATAVLCGWGLSAAASSYVVLHVFDGQHGANPTGSMVIDQAGLLRGTTFTRSHEGYGTLFHMRTDGKHFKSTHYFRLAEDDGQNPVGDLAIDASDTVYGTLRSGGDANRGAIFSDDPVNGYQVLAFIPGKGLGRDPQGGLTRGPDGTLYGTTFWGGNEPDCPCGTVFKWSPATQAFTVLHTFTFDEGGEPQGSLLLQGNTLYGTTSLYGPTLGGQPFSVNTDGSGFTTYTPAEGNTFRSGLIPDANGNLWGVAAGGGKKNVGGIYRITPDGSFQWRAGFSGKDGSYPAGRLLLGKDGLLYGNTLRGGKYGYGAIFSFDPAGTAIKRLHSFHPAHDGYSPSGGLVQDASGALFGTTMAGGKPDYGVIYRFVP